MISHLDRLVRILAFVGILLTVTVLAGARAMAQGYEQSHDPGYDELHMPWPDSESVVDTVRRRGLLKVGVGLFEPWVMCDTSGNLMGYEIDVARKMADDMRVHVQFVRTDWYYIMPALIEEEFDVIISGMGITPERSLIVNFSEPYSSFGTSVIANTAQTQSLTTPEDFNQADIVFGARSGTVPEQVVLDHFSNAMLRSFDSDSELLGALLGGTVHAAAIDQVKATRWLDTHVFMLHRPFDELYNTIPEAIALRKGDVDGLNFLDSWITHHSTTGWLSERRRYWFNTRDWSDQVAADPQVVARCDESFTADPY